MTIPWGYIRQFGVVTIGPQAVRLAPVVAELRARPAAGLDPWPARCAAVVGAPGDGDWQVVRFDDPTIAAGAGGRVPDLVVVNLSGAAAGEDLVARVLREVDAPVIALADDDAVLRAALLSGASAVTRIPCDPEVLLLSAQALLENRALRPNLGQSVTVADLSVSVANHTVERAGRKQVLSATEWQLFAFLLAHPERTFSRDELARGAWGPGFGGRHAEIDLYVFRLRRKVERDPRKPRIVETVRYAGYRLGCRPSFGEVDTRAHRAGTAPDGRSTSSLGDVHTWIAAYSDVVDATSRAYERCRHLAAAALDERDAAGAEGELFQLESDLRRARSRLAAWRQRERELMRQEIALRRVRDELGARTA